MDWVVWSRRLDRSGLERIVALLFAFAVLAERAAGLSGALSNRALGILAYAEAEARAFVIAMAQETGTPSEPGAEVAHCRAEKLAASFRALALVLTVMLALARRFGRTVAAGRQAGVPKPPRKKSAAQKGRHWAAAVTAFDTS